MTETEIIKRCQRGDLTAFRMIFETWHQPMLRVALRMLGNQQDAEDAVQSGFIKLHKSIGGFRFQSKLSTYLFQIVSRVCLDEIRNRRRGKWTEIDENDFPHTPDPALKITLERAIAQLPERMRLCFILFAVEELKQEDIATIMEMSLGGVKATLFQARKKLRESLNEP